MQTFKDYLTEGRDAPLYHGTTLDLALIILNQKKISAEKTSHYIKYNATVKPYNRGEIENKVKSIIKNPNDNAEFQTLFNKFSSAHYSKQITYNKKAIKKNGGLPYSASDTYANMAWGVSLTRSFKFARNFVLDRGHTLEVIVFELNQSKLAQTHKLRPVNFWAQGELAFQDNRFARKLYDGGTIKNEYEEFAFGDIKNLDKYLTKIMVATHAALMTIQSDVNLKELKNHPLLWFNGKFLNANV